MAKKTSKNRRKRHLSLRKAWRAVRNNKLSGKVAEK